MKTKYLPFTLILLSSLLITACTQTANPTTKQMQIPKDILYIGGIAPLSGDGASYGLPIKQAALAIQKEVNKNGGIAGRKIEFVWQDGRCAAEDAKAAATKLINEKKVELLYAGSCSDEFLAAAPIAQEKKIISISSSATSPKISQLGKYIFRLVPSDTMAGKAAAQYTFTKQNNKTAAIIGENTNYATGLTEVFKDEFEKQGGKVIFSETYAAGNTKFKSFVDKVVTARPQVVYIVPQTPTPGVLITKALKDAKVSADLLTAEVLLTRDEVEKQGNILNGMVGLEMYFDSTSQKAEQVIALYQNEYGQENNYPTDLTSLYDLIYLYKEAYEQVGNDSDKISEYLYNLKGWEGATGRITFDRNGDVVSLPYAIQKIEDGKVSLIEQYTVKE